MVEVFINSVAAMKVKGEVSFKKLRDKIHIWPVFCGECGHKIAFSEIVVSDIICEHCLENVYEQMKNAEKYFQ